MSGTGYNYSDSVLQVHKDLIIRPNTAGGGEGLAISYGIGSNANPVVMQIVISSNCYRRTRQ
jgi:hypothetical protein